MVKHTEWVNDPARHMGPCSYVIWQIIGRRPVYTIMLVTERPISDKQRTPNYILGPMS